MITLFKGDDTGGLLGKPVIVEISTEFDLTGCTVIFNYQGIERRWENVHDGDRREVFFSHNETSRMSLGVFKAVILAVDSSGKMRTITNSLPIKVSTNLSECYGDNVAQVTIGTTVNWEQITGKPFEGQEIDIGTDDKVLAALGTIIEKLGGTVRASIALVALCAMSAFGYTPESHTNSFERNGVTYAQRGGLGAADYVVTNVDVHGSGGYLPKYLFTIDLFDTYPEDAKWYYEQADYTDAGACSARRVGDKVERNLDWKFDKAAEFVVRVSGNVERFSSVGVANVGENLTDEFVRSGEHSRYYKCLAGLTVDGINERGVFAEINVVGGNPQSGWYDIGDIHPLGAVRWVLDHGTNAQQAAQHIARNVNFPQGWTQNFHYLIADASETWIVESGRARRCGETLKPILTNFYRTDCSRYGEGQERYDILEDSASSITNVWYTNAYRRETNPPWVSDLHDVLAHTNEIFTAWATYPKEHFRGQEIAGQSWWQTVHTSVYDISNRVLRVAVQETPDWYTFAVPSAGVDLSPVETRLDLQALAIASNAAEIAVIPRITESLENPGWARYAEDALNSHNAQYATEASEANYAANADYAEFAGRIKGPGTLGVYDFAAIAAIEQSATNAEVQASVNAVAISAETTRATAAESALQAQIDLFKSFTAVVTNALPEEGEDGCIYLVPIAGTENKAEWLWVHQPTDHWEKIGTTAIDIAEYAKATELSAHTEDRNNPHGVTAEQVNTYDADEIDSRLTGKVDAIVSEAWSFDGGVFTVSPGSFYIGYGMASALFDEWIASMLIEPATGDVYTASVNYTDTAVATLREKTDLAVYESANAHWVWTSADANTPAGWLDKANEYNAPKPLHNGTSWTIEPIDSRPLYTAPSDPATGTVLVFVFKLSRFGSATFTATATRASATDTTPVAVSGQSLASTYDLMSLTNQTGVAIGLNSSRASTGVAIGQNASAVLSAVAVGGSAVVSGANGLAVGVASSVAGPYSAAFGPSAKTGSAATMSVQLGNGTCNAANTLQFCGAPLGKVDAFTQSTFTLDANVVVPQATAVSNYVDSVLGPISTALDSILGGH